MPLVRVDPYSNLPTCGHMHAQELSQNFSLLTIEKDPLEKILSRKTAKSNFCFTSKSNISLLRRGLMPN